MLKIRENKKIIKLKVEKVEKNDIITTVEQMCLESECKMFLGMIRR